MAEHLLNTVIFALKAFLAYERMYRKGRVFEEDEQAVVENCLDLFTRLKTRTVGVFGEPT